MAFALLDLIANIIFIYITDCLGNYLHRIDEESRHILSDVPIVVPSQKISKPGADSDSSD